ncbi:EGF-like repeat and discoidin I-like domain-containing protein 3 [Amphiura filiformis]|uniref:EGF-like repeat and discoidin I-like domain-containing protein 3 n=1 Tax=Amphiura filiformis TaxID=82378 RepID=UPI003B21D5B5
MKILIVTWILALNVLYVGAPPGGKNKPNPKSDACNPDPCSSAGATCRAAPHNNHICRCPDGSQICDGSAYSCNTNPCRNGGDCSWKKKNKHTDFLCACRENWTGATCEQASNPLVTDPPARPDPGLTENKPITKGKPDIQKTQTTPRPTTRITGTPKSKSKEEEWSLYGLSKVDLIGIVLPMVVGIPGAIIAFAKICITMRNKRAAQDNANKEKPTQSPS